MIQQISVDHVSYNVNVFVLVLFFLLYPDIFISCYHQTLKKIYQPAEKIKVIFVLEFWEHCFSS